MTVAALLHVALQDAGVPISGVSLGVIDDKSTWRIDFDGDPTGEQRATAAATVSAFDIEKAKTDVIAADETAQAVAGITASDVLALLISKGVVSQGDLPTELSAVAARAMPSQLSQKVT